MRSVVAAYPGDTDTVQVDASMIHGMEGMQHGGMEMPRPEVAPRVQRPTQGVPAARRAQPVDQGHGGALAQDEHAHHH